MTPSIEEIYTKLYNHFGFLKWWPADSPLEMMIGAILTQNTSWYNVEKSLANLRDHLSLPALLAIDNNELAELIRPSGYYHQKARYIKELVNWLARYNGDIAYIKTIDANILRSKLLALHGIGPETADCILVYAFDKPFFIIDAYTRRLFKRLGYDVPRSYKSFQEMFHHGFSCHLTVPICNQYHAMIVELSKSICTVNPLCYKCPLRHNCQNYQY